MRTYLKLIFYFICLTSFISSCEVQKGYLVFEGKSDEILATQKIKNFISKNPNPSIVLRVPITEKQSTQSDPNGYIYNAIEKELVIAGFNVKDRGLFNEVINKSKEIDYKKIKELTGTDLILELVRTDLSVAHLTNTYYDNSGKPAKVDDDLWRSGEYAQTDPLIPR